MNTEKQSSRKDPLVDVISAYHVINVSGAPLRTSADENTGV